MGAKTNSGYIKKVLAQTESEILVRVDTNMMIRDRNYEVSYHEFWNNLDKYNLNIHEEYPERYGPPIVYGRIENNLSDGEAIELFHNTYGRKI